MLPRLFVFDPPSGGRRKTLDPEQLDTRDTIMEAIGIQVTDISEERVVATMPVHGPTLP